MRGAIHLDENFAELSQSAFERLQRGAVEFMRDDQANQFFVIAFFGAEKFIAIVSASSRSFRHHDDRRAISRARLRADRSCVNPYGLGA